MQNPQKFLIEEDEGEAGSAAQGDVDAEPVRRRSRQRVVRGRQEVPVGATYADALQVQQWMDRLESGPGRLSVPAKAPGGRA